MTAQGKPLSQRFSEAYDFGFIKHEHRSVFDALEALKPEIGALEAERDSLNREISRGDENNARLTRELYNENERSVKAESALREAQALIEKWRKEMPSVFFPSRDGLICADELEEALRHVLH